MGLKHMFYSSLLLVIGFFINLYNITLFHTLIEFICILIAGVMFIIAINTHRHNDNHYIILLGVAYGFVGLFTFFHMLTFDGIDVFNFSSTNLSVQLWILASFIESISLLYASYLIKTQKRIRIEHVFNLYLILSIFMVAKTLYFRNFYESFIEGIGLTPFKIYSEYLVSIVLILSIFILYQGKKQIKSYIYTLLILNLGFNIASKLAFTLFIDIDHIWFFIGHIFKVVAFYFIYKAIVKTSLIEPYEILNQQNQQLVLDTKKLETINLELQEEMVRRHEIENELSNKEKILQAILNSTSSAICVTDDNYEYIYTNKKFNEAGFFPNQAEGNGCTLATYIKDQLIDCEGFLANIQKIIKVATDHRDLLYFKDGRILEQRYYPLKINKMNAGKVWSFRDITNELKTQEMLLNSEERFKKLIEMMPETLIVHDGIEVIYANPSSINIFNVEHHEQLIGRKIVELFVGDDVEDIIQNITYQNKNKTLMQFQLANGRESEVDVEVASVHFEDQGRSLMMTIIRDVTLWKETERLKLQIIEESKLIKEIQEYDRLKTEFFSNISHELKTPLNIILSAIQLIECKQTEQESQYAQQLIHFSRKYMHMMKQNCYRLLRLINNLIDISRLDAGFLKADLKNHNIVDVVEAITLSITQYVESKSINIVFDTEIEEKIMACDVDKIERIMLNLLSNAIKFTKSGGLINVNLYDRGDSIWISVKDTGIGIPENMLGKVFERFRQVDTLLNRRAEGSGIGLSLVKALVELHGGEVSVQSKYGFGSEFIIKLPITVIEDFNFENEAVATIDTNIERISVEFSDIYNSVK